MALEKLFMIKIAKILNYTSVLLMAVSVILRFIDFGQYSDIFFYLLTFYLIGFGALILLAELKWHRVILFVMFLNGRFGKGAFLMFVGLILFDDQRKSDLAISIALVLIGFFNIIVSCMRKHSLKDYDEDEEEDASESNMTEEIDSVDEEEAAYYERLKKRAKAQHKQKRTKKRR